MCSSLLLHAVRLDPVLMHVVLLQAVLVHPVAVRRHRRRETSGRGVSRRRPCPCPWTCPCRPARARRRAGEPQRLRRPARLLPPPPFVCCRFVCCRLVCGGLGLLLGGNPGGFGLPGLEVRPDSVDGLADALVPFEGHLPAGGRLVQFQHESVEMLQRGGRIIGGGGPGHGKDLGLQLPGGIAVQIRGGSTAAKGGGDKRHAEDRAGEAQHEGCCGRRRGTAG